MKKFSGGMNIGTSSVLSAFVILCMVTFAGLSFLSANTDNLLSRQGAEKTKEYYRAAGNADIMLVQIHNELTEIAKESKNEEEYYEAVLSKYDNNSQDSFYNLYEDEGLNLYFTLPVNDRQNLRVVLQVNYPHSGDYSVFHIQSYSTEANPEWVDDSKKDGDNNMNLVTFE
ncbi:MAG: hypothetical protein K5931_01845 [Lachnospiraceae bacterium]|nr:hypothetical protein [Lachnospiraceae bacterium]